MRKVCVFSFICFNCFICSICCLLNINDLFVVNFVVFVQLSPVEQRKIKEHLNHIFVVDAALFIEEHRLHKRRGGKQTHPTTSYALTEKDNEVEMSTTVVSTPKIKGSANALNEIVAEEVVEMEDV